MPAGKRLDEHVSDCGSLEWPRDDWLTRCIGGELAQQRVSGAATDDVDSFKFSAKVRFQTFKNPSVFER
jgi:hypothetical protein